MVHLRKQTGVTILETMLALAIAASITVLVLNQYTSMSKDTNAQQVQYTVNMLFQGMGNYYRAFCRNPINSLGNVIPDPTGNSLDPRDPGNNPLKNPFPIVNASTFNLLVSNSFLDTKDWPPSPNPIVDPAFGDHGYVTQFNITVPTSATHSPVAVYNNWTPTATTVALTNVGSVYVVRSQVAVYIKGDAATVQAYKARFAANCISNLSGNTVTPCPGGAGNFIVWERLPSYGSGNTSSSSWLTMGRIRQFKSLYTNDDMYGASNPNWAYPTSGGPGGNLYLCGG